MQIDKVSPIDWLDVCIRQDRRLYWFAKERIGTKITDLALGYLSSVPCFDGDILRRGLCGAQVSWESSGGKGQARLLEKKRTKHPVGIPIGLKFSGIEWFNAWVQFVIYLPKFFERVSFAEKAFKPFADFVDQYTWDQEKGRLVSFAESERLYDCLLAQKIPMLDLSSLCRLLFGAMFPDLVSEDCVLFHPEWVWTTLEEGFFPKQLIVAMPSMSRQLRLNQGRTLYDLDSFMEKRLNGDKARFITYIRIQGGWYQCEEEEVRLVPSSMLSVPLKRGILFHYKQVVV
jgi:hypothetical protein